MPLLIILCMFGETDTRKHPFPNRHLHYCFCPQLWGGRFLDSSIVNKVETPSRVVSCTCIYLSRQVQVTILSSIILLFCTSYMPSFSHRYGKRLLYVARINSPAQLARACIRRYADISMPSSLVVVFCLFTSGVAGVWASDIEVACTLVVEVVCTSDIEVACTLVVEVVIWAVCGAAASILFMSIKIRTYYYYVRRAHPMMPIRAFVAYII